MEEIILCLDCDADLSARDDWEPVIVLQSGEHVHTRICYACIDDIETIGFAEIARACREEMLSDEKKVCGEERSRNEMQDDMLDF